MGRINQVPRGLQFLLGNTNFGDNPSELNDITGPTLEQFPFLAQTLMDYTKNARQITQRGDFLEIVVPEGEAWMPINMTANIAGFNEIGTQWSARLEIKKINRQDPLVAGARHVWKYSEVFTSIAVGEIIGFGYDFPDRFLVPSFSEFTVAVDHYVPGVGVILDDSLDLQLQMYRFKV